MTLTKYTTTGQRQVIPPAPVTPPAAPAPQQRAAAPVGAGYDLHTKKQALQAELDAVVTAEQNRLNAEAEALRKQNLLKQEIAEIERAERETEVSSLVASGQRIAAGSAANVTELYRQLETIVSAFDSITSDVTIKASFDHFVDTAQQAIAHAMPTEFDFQQARRSAGAVLSQLGQPPIALLPTLKQWILSAHGEQEKHMRMGLTLALTGVFINPAEIPAGYSAANESAEIVRALAMPQ